ncbi:DeoR/GlpR family DNA-binding transcription regulator [Granulosicoccus sp. 3-233]|uniref:DeoR/GlpR family DNA-binding transcription regulator n=1 Tax=Granulosicoccus sp. 3-233 TaxID=3417969 RepID=UPI003D35019E
MSQTLDLNNPDTRREALLERLERTGQLVATELVDSFGVSGDTIRRDLLALENDGLLRRVRGGALPVARPTRPFHVRSRETSDAMQALASRAALCMQPRSALLVDGGTTAVAFTRELAAALELTIITPSPAVAVAAMGSAREVILIGGRLSESGGMATGAQAEREIALCTADMAIIGACSVSAEQGLGADDHEEAGVKRTMIQASLRTMVIASADKFGQRSRYCVVPLAALDLLVSDVSADRLSGFPLDSLELIHV